MNSYNFMSEPKESLLPQLLSVAVKFCSRGSLVVRNQSWLDENGRSVIDAISPYVLSEENCSEWPGTRLLDDTALVLTFSFNEQVAHLLGTSATGLFDFQSGLPEDLALYRPNGDVWLGSIAHEKDAWLTLTTAEYNELESAVKALLEGSS